MFQPSVILHPTDFSETAHAAFGHAVDLARRHDADLHLLHVSTDFGDDPIRDAYEAKVDTEGFNRAIRAAAVSNMKEMLATVETDDVAITTTYERGVAAAPIILEYATVHSADLIVMGTHGRRRVRRFVMGSVTEEVMRYASCSVLTVRHETDAGPRAVERVLVPLDLSETSERLLGTAEAVAASFDASLDVLHVVEPLPFTVPLLGGITLRDLLPNPEESTMNQLASMAERIGSGDVAIQPHVAEGDADHTILETAETLGTDLIVIASHNASRIQRALLGSVTARVLRRADCPVLVVRFPAESDSNPTLDGEPNAATDAPEAT